MRIGILTYPMLFQCDSSLRAQVRAILSAFSTMRTSPLYGQIDAVLVDPQRECLDEYDLIHVIGAANGNHTVVEMAAACGVPVVLTPLIAASWRRAEGARARLAGHVLGRLLKRDMQSSYAQQRRALDLATIVVSQSGAERRAIAAAFLTEPAKLRVVAQGVDQAYFDAESALFRQRCGFKGEFALMAGPVSPRHRQLELAHTMHEMALPLLVTGPSAQRDAAYVQQLRAVPGVLVLGDLSDQPRLRASVFAAANMLVLPPVTEACSETTLGGLQALAAGTAVLADRAAATAYALPESETGVRLLPWYDSRRRKAAIVALLDNPPLRDRIRGLVRDHVWGQIAARLLHCYADAITLQGSNSSVSAHAAGPRKLPLRVLRQVQGTEPPHPP